MKQKTHRVSISLTPQILELLDSWDTEGLGLQSLMIQLILAEKARRLALPTKRSGGSPGVPVAKSEPVPAVPAPEPWEEYIHRDGLSPQAARRKWEYERELQLTIPPPGKRSS